MMDATKKTTDLEMVLQYPELFTHGKIVKFISMDVYYTFARTEDGYLHVYVDGVYTHDKTYSFSRAMIIALAWRHMPASVPFVSWAIGRLLGLEGNV